MSNFWDNDGAADGGNGYRYLDWFGWFNVNSAPWIYHTQHGWMYPEGNSLTAGMYLYNVDLGYVWTSKAIYPWMFSVTENSYLMYIKDSNPRSFYHNNRHAYESYNFVNFASQPKDIVGYGFPSNWMWFDPIVIGNTLASNKVNTTYVDWGGCNPTSNPAQAPSYWGYWNDKWSQVAPRLTAFLDIMKMKKITVIVPVCAWNYMNGIPDPANSNKPSTICSTWCNDEWFMEKVNYFKARGPEGLYITPFIEPGHGKATDSCLNKMWHWKELFDAAWPWGNKLWNGANAAGDSQPGYGIECHAQHVGSSTPANSIIVTDSPVQSEISTGNWPDTKADPSKVKSYFQTLHNQGKGCVYWSGRVDSYIDVTGIKAVGSITR